MQNQMPTAPTDMKIEIWLNALLRAGGVGGGGGGGEGVRGTALQSAPFAQTMPQNRRILAIWPPSVVASVRGTRANARVSSVGPRVRAP
jgi:hypothetical protein